jgi:hypothetical protein
MTAYVVIQGQTGTVTNLPPGATSELRVSLDLAARSGAPGEPQQSRRSRQSRLTPNSA